MQHSMHVFFIVTWLINEGACIGDGRDHSFKELASYYSLLFMTMKIKILSGWSIMENVYMVQAMT